MLVCCSSDRMYGHVDVDRPVFIWHLLLTHAGVAQHYQPCNAWQQDCWNLTAIPSSSSQAGEWQVVDEEGTKKKQEEADKKAKEEGKDAADKVDTQMKNSTKDVWDWTVQNDSKPLWTRSPREVCAGMCCFGFDHLIAANCISFLGFLGFLCKLLSAASHAMFQSVCTRVFMASKSGLCAGQEGGV